MLPISFSGIHRGSADSRVHVWRHDADPVVALCCAKPPRTHTKVHSGNARTRDDRVLVQEYHQARPHQYYTQLPQGNLKATAFLKYVTSINQDFFQLCVILEPMQELMSRHKAYALSPRDCLKTTLFQKWQKMVAPPGKIQNKTECPEESASTILCFLRQQHVQTHSWRLTWTL